MAFRQLMNKFSKLMKKKPQPKLLADFVDKPRKLWSEENAENLRKNWTEEQVQELMKYKLKVEYDPKMPLDRYELIYNPQDLELLKKLGEKKEEKEGIKRRRERTRRRQRRKMPRPKREREMGRSEMANFNFIPRLNQQGFGTCILYGISDYTEPMNRG